MEYDREDQIALMQHLIVFQIVHEGLRHGIRVGDRVDRRTRDPMHMICGQGLDERHQLWIIVADSINQQFTTEPLGCHDREDGQPKYQRKPAPPSNKRSILFIFFPSSFEVVRDVCMADPLPARP
jgi:hypothetical protein